MTEKAKEHTTRMIFTVVYWLIAALIGIKILESKIVRIDALHESLEAFFRERIDIPIIIFQVSILAIIALTMQFIPSEKISREIRLEALRLYYTIGAAGGAISIFSGKIGSACWIYGFGVFVPWLLIFLNVRDDLIGQPIPVTSSRANGSADPQDPKTTAPTSSQNL